MAPASDPYNENLAQTYESSEFEALAPDSLPGNIFAAGRPSGDKSKQHAGRDKPSSFPYHPHGKQQSRPSHGKNDELTSVEKSKLLMNSSQKSDQSIGNLQVGLDSSHNKFYALANPQLNLQLQNSSGPGTSSQGEQTQLHAQMDRKIHKQNSVELNPYDNANNLMCQSLKVGQMQKEDFIQPADDYKKIESDIHNLTEKYRKEGEREEKPMTERSINTEDQLNQALKELEGSTEDVHNLLLSKTKRGSRASRVSQNKGSDDNSEFEREEMSNGDNYDKIIHQILENDDDLFQRKKKQTMKEQRDSEGEAADKATLPLDLRKQGSSEPQGAAGRSGEQKEGPKERREEKQIEVERDSDSSSKEEHLPPNDPPFVCGLESDLETILETDQESNYMTTARTIPQQAKPANPGPQANQKQQPLPEKKKEQQIILDQTITSLNNSSFFFNDNNPNLPQALYQNEKSDLNNESLFDHESIANILSARKQSGEKGMSNFLNDISPIAHAIDGSHYQNTRYTNILDSNRTEQNEKKNQTPTGQMHKPQNPFKKLTYKASDEVEIEDAPDDQNLPLALFSKPSEEQQVDKSLPSFIIPDPEEVPEKEQRREHPDSGMDAQE